MNVFRCMFLELWLLPHTNWFYVSHNREIMPRLCRPFLYRCRCRCRCICDWVPGYETKQCVHYWHLPCPYCTETCRHVSAIHKYFLYASVRCKRPSVVPLARSCAQCVTHFSWHQSVFYGWIMAECTLGTTVGDEKYLCDLEVLGTKPRTNWWSHSLITDIYPVTETCAHVSSRDRYTNRHTNRHTHTRIMGSSVYPTKT